MISNNSKFIRHNAPIIERFIWKFSFRALKKVAILIKDTKPKSKWLKNIYY